MRPQIPMKPEIFHHFSQTKLVRFEPKPEFGLLIFEDAMQDFCLNF